MTVTVLVSARSSSACILYALPEGREAARRAAIGVAVARWRFC